VCNGWVLDHIVVAAPDLAAAVTWFTDLTGVRPVPGGRHQGLGTANYLAGLGGGAYLEILGPDPDPDPDQPAAGRPRPFGIGELPFPRVATWAIRPDDLDRQIAAARANGYDPGQPQAMSRATPDGEVLRWRLTPLDPTIGDGLVPFLIDWGDTPHPTTRGLPTVPLVSFEATHPAPDSVRPALAALGVDLPVRAGDRAALTVVLEGRHGPVTIT
jgi:hypothetical protein